MDGEEVGEGPRTCFVCRVEYDNSTLVDPVRFEAALKSCGLPKGTATVGIRRAESVGKDRASYEVLLAFPHRVRWWDVGWWMERLGAGGGGGRADVCHWPDYRERGEEFLREHAGDFSDACFGSLDSVRAVIKEGDGGLPDCPVLSKGAREQGIDSVGVGREEGNGTSRVS
jgi:hypothetical protein